VVCALWYCKRKEIYIFLMSYAKGTCLVWNLGNQSFCTWKCSQRQLNFAWDPDHVFFFCFFVCLFFKCHNQSVAHLSKGSMWGHCSGNLLLIRSPIMIGHALDIMQEDGQRP
jgi:hypothetical protein